jgi:hypothetical protein
MDKQHQILFLVLFMVHSDVWKAQSLKAQSSNKLLIPYSFYEQGNWSSVHSPTARKWQSWEGNPDLCCSAQGAWLCV